MPDPTAILTLIREELSSYRPLRDFSGITNADHLFDDLNLDSLDRMSLAIELEHEFGLDISDEAVSGWATVGDVVRSLGA